MKTFNTTHSGKCESARHLHHCVPCLKSENPVKKLILLLSMVLAGCAAEVLSTTDQLIVVKARERNRPEAQDLAEAKCQQRGLHARLTRRLAEDQLGFECVR